MDLEARRVAGRWLIADLDGRVLDGFDTEKTEPSLSERIRSHFRTIQAEHSQPLPPEAPKSQDGIRRFILEAAREELRAEVVAVNRGAPPRVGCSVFRARVQDPGGSGRGCPHRPGSGWSTSPVQSFSELAAEESLRKGPTGWCAPQRLLGFMGLELEVKDAGTATPTLKSVTVNGRPLQKSDPYRVATTTFLLLGGDGYSVLKGAEPEEGESRLSSAATWCFSRLERAEVPFPDLERRGLWRYGVDRLALSFDGVSTDRNPAYKESTDSRARADDSSAIRGEFRLRGDLERDPVRWENRLLGSYGRQKTQNESQETDDDLRFDTSVVFLNAPVLRGEPFLAYTLDTEFVVDSNPSGEPIPRQLEQSLTGGLSWTRPHWPRIRIGAAYRRYENLDRDDQLGITGEAHYLRDKKGRVPGVEVLLLAEHLTAPDSAVTRFDLELRGLFPLYGSLSFSPGFNYYFLDDSALAGHARYYRLSVGFTYDWLGKRQRW